MKDFNRQMIDLVATARTDLFKHYPFIDESIKSAVKKLSQVIDLYYDENEPTNAADADQPCVHDYVEIPAVACTKCGHVRR